MEVHITPLHSFLTSAQMELNERLHAPADLPPGKDPAIAISWVAVQTHCPSAGCENKISPFFGRTSVNEIPQLLPYLCVVPQAMFNPLNPKLNPICYLLALLGAHHFLHVSRIRVKLLTFRLLTSYIYEAPILDVSRSHTTTQHSR